MSKWEFNMPLFSRLAEVLDITGTEIARRCGLRQQVFSRYTTNESVVNIQVLIKLCNAIRMPIYYFVSENHNYIIPNRETATIPFDDWQPVSWDYDAVERTFGDGDGRINWKDVAVAMKTSSQKPHERFALRRRFKVTDFFTACNAFSLSPFLFLIDPNRPNPKGSKRRTTASTHSLKKPAAPSYPDLSRRMDSLENNLTDLQQKYTDLQQKYEDLQKAHEELIRLIQNANIGINFPVDMAAESDHEKE